MAVGGAAYLVSKAIRKSRVLAFEDLGMEAIYEFEVKDMPVTVAVDANGTSVHSTGPAEWSKKIVELKLPGHCRCDPTWRGSLGRLRRRPGRRRLHDEGSRRRCRGLRAELGLTLVESGLDRHDVQSDGHAGGHDRRRCCAIGSGTSASRLSASRCIAPGRAGRGGMGIREPAARSRFLEGVGFILFAVSALALMNAPQRNARDRAKALGLWSSYMPTGGTIALLAAPLRDRRLGLARALGGVRDRGTCRRRSSLARLLPHRPTAQRRARCAW